MSLIHKIRSYPFRLKLCSVLFRNWRFASCGERTLVGKPLLASYKSILLGDCVYIWRNCRIEAVKEYAGQQYSPLILIGSGVSIQQNLHLTCAERVEIGANTAIAANVTITDINHQYQDILMPPKIQPIMISPVVIGENCNIHNNVVITPGVKIGRHCIVGANSVVVTDLPDYSVAVGAPAKIVRLYNSSNQLWEKI